MTKRLKLAVLLFVAICCGMGLSSSERNVETSVAADVKALYSDNIVVREQASQRLRSAGSSIVPLLVPVICEQTAPGFDNALPLAAKLLGDLKAEAAAPCLVRALMYRYPSIGLVIMKSDETLASVDPAFAALISIGEPAVQLSRESYHYWRQNPQ